MKAEELRIGNYFQWKSTKDIEQVYNIVSDFKWQGNARYKTLKIANINDVSISDTEPIPLTEEWLVKLWTNSINYWIDTQYGKFWFQPLSLEIEHVHQLQNLYFALVGEELKIKK
jgi:hypothetical protein